MKLNSLDKQFLGIIQSYRELNSNEIDVESVIQFAQKQNPSLQRKPLKNLKQSCSIAMEYLFKEEPSTENMNPMNNSVMDFYGKPTDESAQKRRKTDSKLPKESLKTGKSAAKLEDIGGMDHIIQELLELIGLPLTHPEIFTSLGIDPPRGVLLYGPPGTGKTMLANAIANEINVPFISIAAPVIVSGMSGESEKKLREIFEEAKQQAPCILFIDEIDAITPKRETAQREMERRIVAQFLTCMDGIFY